MKENGQISFQVFSQVLVDKIKKRQQNTCKSSIKIESITLSTTREENQTHTHTLTVHWEMYQLSTTSQRFVLLLMPYVAYKLVFYLFFVQKFKFFNVFMCEWSSCIAIVIRSICVQKYILQIANLVGGIMLFCEKEKKKNHHHMSSVIVYFVWIKWNAKQNLNKKIIIFNSFA